MAPSTYVVIYSAVAALLTAIAGPFLGAISDYSNYRKLFAQIGTYAGALFAATSVILISPSL